MVSDTIFSRKNSPKRKIDVEVNRDNLEKLIVEYQPRLKSFIRKRVNSKEEAEDILQEVFYRLVKTVNTAIDPIEQAAAWLYRVARNQIVNHSIKKREEAYPVWQSDDDTVLQDFAEILFDSDASPETEYLRSLVWSELDAALSELPAEQRDVFEKTELLGMSVKETAEAAGVPVNTVLSRKRYAVLYLRKRLQDLYLEALME